MTGSTQTTTVSRKLTTAGEVYFEVDTPDLSSSQKSNLEWMPSPASGEDFCLVGLAGYDCGDLSVDKIEVKADRIEGKADKKTGPDGQPYIVLVLDRTDDPTDPQVHMAYGGTPSSVHPLAGQDRPEPPPKVIIN